MRGMSVCTVAPEPEVCLLCVQTAVRALRSECTRRVGLAEPSPSEITRGQRDVGGGESVCPRSWWWLHGVALSSNLPSCVNSVGAWYAIHTGGRASHVEIHAWGEQGDL